MNIRVEYFMFSREIITIEVHATRLLNQNHLVQVKMVANFSLRCKYTVSKNSYQFIRKFYLHIYVILLEKLFVFFITVSITLFQTDIVMPQLNVHLYE